MRPVVTRLPEPGQANVISDALIVEYVGYDPGLDLAQDAVVQALKRAVVEQGEQYTSTVWAEAEYIIDRLPLAACGWSMVGQIVMPLSPVFEVLDLYAVDYEGSETVLEKNVAWSFIRPLWNRIAPGALSTPSAAPSLGLAGLRPRSAPAGLRPPFRSPCGPGRWYASRRCMINGSTLSVAPSPATCRVTTPGRCWTAGR